VSLCAVALVALFAAKPAVAFRQYKVVEGDSLWLIARRFSTSVYAIKQLNGVSANKPLRIGRTLTIPASASSPKAETAASTVARTQATHRLVSPRSAQPARSTVTKRPGDSSQSAAVPTTQRVVRSAMTYRGTRYRRGGTSRVGFDCSGFTRHVYMKEGISLPHSSRAQSRLGKPVSRGELQVGDLVFFSTGRGGISHVGIYIGGGKFIHSSNHGRGVTIDSLDSNYYRARYRCARRVK